jgi:hypothetical protein
VADPGSASPPQFGGDMDIPSRWHGKRRRLVYPPCMVVEPQQEEVDAHQVPTTPITCPWTMRSWMA